MRQAPRCHVPSRRRSPVRQWGTASHALQEPWGTYDVALTAPSLFTALLRRDPRRASRFPLREEASRWEAATAKTRPGRQQRDTAAPMNHQPRQRQARGSRRMLLRGCDRPERWPARGCLGGQAAARSCRSGSVPGARLHAIPRVRFVGCGYRPRVRAYAHHSPREPRGGAAGRPSRPPSGGQATPSQLRGRAPGGSLR